MLPVGIDDQDHLSGRSPDTGLDGRAVSLVVRMTNDAGSSVRGAIASLVFRTIIDHQDFVPCGGPKESCDQWADRGGFVEGWNDH